MHNTREEVVASSNDPITDDALVFSARNGNEQAFGMLAKRYEERILAVALRHTRVQQDAEDVVQQSLQKAFVNLNHFEGKSSFATWLTRIAINEALMLLRKGRARREVSLDNSTDIERTPPRLEIRSGRPDPEAICLQQEWMQILSEAMVKLRPGIREAIQLRDLDELSTEDTARRMGLSVAGTKARVLQGDGSYAAN
jgi:RNA polymerase sigma-70 factor, ECF subfamily